jgi:2-phospho-L-lactate guanylyltransferase
LNGALALGAERAIGLGARGLVVVPTDLALVSAAALAEALVALPAAPGCLIVPDRRGSGTNLLALSPARADLFRFGAFSPQKHAEAAALAGYEVRVHQSPDLALDLDLPEDYFDWRRGLDAPTSPRQASLPEKILRA